MTSVRPLPPPPAAPPGLCGSDEAPAVGWRWYRAAGIWERVCIAHSGGVQPFKKGDYVPDWANVERTPKENHG